MDAPWANKKLKKLKRKASQLGTKPGTAGPTTPNVVAASRVTKGSKKKHKKLRKKGRKAGGGPDNTEAGSLVTGQLQGPNPLKPTKRHTDGHDEDTPDMKASTSPAVAGKGAAPSNKRDAATQGKPAALPANKKTKSSKWPFPTDYLDHFETSLDAIKDIEPMLVRLAHALGKSKAQLVVYDPYFCQGGIRKHYEALGLMNLVHENRDFYADIAGGRVPEYDILVTNPPYSEDHKERILAFCAESGKPWALLMPNYVANKQYYSDIVLQLGSQKQGGGGGKEQSGHAATSSSSPQGPSSPPFFMVPNVKYEYAHPEGTGHSSSPFFSIWFVHLGTHNTGILRWLEQHAGQATQAGGQQGLKHASSGGVKVMRSLDELKQSSAVPTWKRPNPKQRRRMKRQQEQQ